MDSGSRTVFKDGETSPFSTNLADRSYYNESAGGFFQETGGRSNLVANKSNWITEQAAVIAAHCVPE